MDIKLLGQLKILKFTPEVMTLHSCVPYGFENHNIWSKAQINFTYETSLPSQYLYLVILVFEYLYTCSYFG